jgi:purine-binding chemotaxis protein CheW
MSRAHYTIEQLTTFYVRGELFGIEVLNVQEVTGQPNVISVPLAPQFVRGLINLRGQITTAIDLSVLFENKFEQNSNKMSVVCKIDGNLVSLIVDSIGEVAEVQSSQFELAPDTMPIGIKRYVKGIYKMNDVLLSVIDLESIAKELSPPVETTQERNS